MRYRIVLLLLAVSGLAALTVGVLTQRPEPVRASGVTSIAAGGNHTCALTEAGGVQCWGQNLAGQVGDGTTAERRFIPVDVLEAPDGPPLGGIEAIAAGGSYTCGLTAAGGVQCWGNNLFGQLGDGTTANRTTPVEVLGLESGVAAVAAGDLHACALTEGGMVKCWGRNESGQLGDGTRGDGNSETLDNIQTAPVDVCQDYVDGAQRCMEPLSGVTAIAGGANHTCALMATGEAKCWGDNIGGQLGDGTGYGSLLDPIVRPTPVDVCQDYDDLAEQCVETLPGLTTVAAGLFHTCALTDAVGVTCWGASFDGKLGDGRVCGADFPFVCTTPVAVCQQFDTAAQQCTEPLSGVAAVDLGLYHACVRTTSQAVKCWGDNDFGQLGAGTGSGPDTPVQVLGMRGLRPQEQAVTVVAGGNHTCALMVTGNVKCWGKNFWAQLGTGTCCGDLSVPEDVVGLGPKPAPTARHTQPAPAPPPTSPPAPSATAPLAVVLPATGADAVLHDAKRPLWPVAALAGTGLTALVAWFAVARTRRRGQRKAGRT